MLRNLPKRLFILLLSGAPLGPLAADELSVKPVAKVMNLHDVTAYTLPNGLKVLLYPDASQPEVTVNILYKTGARHESSGEYGMAHLLEHLLFKRTRNHPDIPKELESRGARFNANTNADRTTYYATFPASPHHLEYAIALEADRMTSAVLNEASLQAELPLVKNEWEQSGGSGFQPLLKEMLQIAYPHHAYGRDTLGIHEGVLQTRLESLQAFYQRRYGPNLAVLSIGGGFAIDEARRLIDKYFATIPAIKTDEQNILEPRPQESERQVLLQRPGGPSYVAVMYRAMAGADRQYAAAQALVHCLSSGSQSSLQKELVQRGLASEAFGFVQQSLSAGFVAFMVKPAKGSDPVRLAQKLSALVERSSHSCTNRDLAQYKKENSQAWAELSHDARGMTMQLSEYELLGDWRLMLEEQERGRQLQLNDLNEVARGLIPSQRTAGVLDHRPLASKKRLGTKAGPSMSQQMRQGLQMFQQP